MVRYLMYSPDTNLLLRRFSRLSTLPNKGFTLIEVVLVLAIGGLIFLLAFLAFSQAQQNRRDTQRRSDLGRIVAELQNFYTDTGAYPSGNTYNRGAGTVCDGGGAGGFLVFVATYLCKDGQILSPDGVNYGIVQ